MEWMSHVCLVHAKDHRKRRQSVMSRGVLSELRTRSDDVPWRYYLVSSLGCISRSLRTLIVFSGRGDHPRLPPRHFPPHSDRCVPLKSTENLPMKLPEIDLCIPLYIYSLQGVWRQVREEPGERTALYGRQRLSHGWYVRVHEQRQGSRWQCLRRILSSALRIH